MTFIRCVRGEDAVAACWCWVDVVNYYGESVAKPDIATAEVVVERLYGMSFDH